MIHMALTRKMQRELDYKLGTPQMDTKYFGEKLDKRIEPLVHYFNKLGFLTVASCEGKPEEQLSMEETLKEMQEGETPLAFGKEGYKKVKMHLFEKPTIGFATYELPRLKQYMAEFEANHPHTLNLKRKLTSSPSYFVAKKMRLKETGKPTGWTYYLEIEPDNLIVFEHFIDDKLRSKK